MADPNPRKPDYANPKVTTAGSSSSKKNWIWIAVAIIVALILLFWLLGSGDETEVVPPAADVETVDPAAGGAAPPAE